MQQRITKVREVITSQKLDALFITNQYNISYLTGFNGLSADERAGFLLVGKKSAHLLTFSTYYEMYKSGGDGFVTYCISMDKRIPDHLAEIIKKENLKTTGFEKESITVAELFSLQKKLPIVWRETAGIVEKFREVKDDHE